MALEIKNWIYLSKKLLWKNSTAEDCSFIIGEGVNARTFSAHKAILANASETFNSMFNGNYKEADASFNIPLPNVVHYKDFEVLLEYIYFTKTDTIQLLDLERLKHIAYLAKYYMLNQLFSDFCHDSITKLANGIDSFHDYLQIFEYQEKLNQHVFSNFKFSSAVLTTNTSIYDLEPPYFYSLLKKLNGNFRESERFCLIENYAKIHGLKMGGFWQETSGSISLKDMFELIRFREMTDKEFESGPAVSRIWIKSPEEKLFILKNLVAGRKVTVRYGKCPDYNMNI